VPTGQPIDVHFPFLGKDARYGFQTGPLYTTPSCLNVRSDDVFEGRQRGGSRPGLVRILPPRASDDPPDIVGDIEQPPIDISPTKDVRIEGHADTDDANWNVAQSLKVGNDYALQNPLRTLFHFDLSNLPTNATIIVATLVLTRNYSLGTPACKIYRLTRTAWTETGCTWNKYDGTNTWTTPGGDFDLADPAPIDWSVDANETKSINVLSHALDAWNTPARAKQLNVILKLATESATIEWGWYYGREYASVPSRRPKLSVTYTVPA
jgi:hypothetical protein